MANNNWIYPNTIFLTMHGSTAYGMAVETSDRDIKGVVIPPREVREHLFEKFEQAENHPFIEEFYGNFKNPLNPKMESIVYSLSKFFTLAAAVNPSIIEILWTDPQHHLRVDPIWKLISDNRKLFLSTRARHSFVGYAHQQLSKIERHRKWIRFEKEPEKPRREDFGLNSPEISREFAAVDRAIRQQIETWNFSKMGLDTLDLAKIKEQCWDLVTNLNMAANISWDNWPESYWLAGIVKLQNRLQLPSETLKLIQAEREYDLALKEYQGYLHWKNERNESRKILERQYGFDTKHAAHLIRLLRAGYELVATGSMNVLRPDAQELLSIRNGAWPYEKVIEYARSMEKEIETAAKQSPLPHSVDYTRINALYHLVIEQWDAANK